MTGMNNQSEKSAHVASQLQNLRRRAEDVTREKTGDVPLEVDEMSPEETRKMFHELNVHQVELEIQNEELRLAQVELDVARVRYFYLFDLAPVGYVVVSEKALILEANINAASLLGEAQGTLIKQSITRFILPEDQDIFYNYRKQLFSAPLADLTSLQQARSGQAGISYACELRMVKTDGTVFWVHLAATSSQDYEDDLVFRIVLSDITDRKKAEESLRESEARYALLTHVAADDGLWDWHVPSGKAFFSAVYYRMLGYEEGEFPASYESMRYLIHPDDVERVEKDFRLSLESGKGFNLEFRMMKKTGEYQWVSTHGKAVEKDAKNTALRVVGNLIDITERKLAEQVIKASEERYRSLFENMLNGFAYCKMHFDDDDRPCDFTYLSVNGAFETLTGLRDVVGKKATEIMPGIRESDPELLERYGRVSKTGKPERFEIFFEVLQKWFLVSLYCPDHGYFVAVFDVITERKQAEQELQDKNTELERFAYTVSHDLKSPLITIQTYAGMILKDMEAGKYDRAHEDIKRIELAASKMTNLLVDLLDLSRVGKMMGEPSPIDMNHLVKEVLLQLAGLVTGSQAEVIVQPDLPTVIGDRKRIAEVVQNMVENAVKYMGNQVAPRIEIGARIADKEPVFFVSDNGKGIDPKFHESIFGLFNKLEAKSEGTGVGLTVVKRIVEVHGGRVWVESEGVGKGSTFCFTVGKWQ